MFAIYAVIKEFMPILKLMIIGILHQPIPNPDHIYCVIYSHNDSYDTWNTEVLIYI